MEAVQDRRHEVNIGGRGSWVVLSSACERDNKQRPKNPKFTPGLRNL